MPLFVILLIIIALYARTYNNYYLIDDYSPRHQYPHPEKKTKDPKFYLTKPNWWVHPFMIAMHCVNTSIIYLLWGWAPAILFAVHPMTMWGAAWLTGNWYATTTYFILISFYFLTHFPGWGIAPAMIFYYVAMYSTFDAIPYPFILILSGNILPGVLMLPLTGMFLSSRKFQDGLKGRESINKGRYIDRMDFPINRLAVMVKTTALYVQEALIPMKIKLFEPYGESIRDHQHIYDKMHAWNANFWAALALLVVTFFGGLLVSPLGTLWFFVFIGLHCQFQLTGQNYAQRYLYIALPGMCLVAGTILVKWPWVLMMAVGFMICKTHTYMKKWKNQEDFLISEIDTVPERAGTYGTLFQLYFTIASIEGYQPYMINLMGYLIRRSVEMDQNCWQTRMNLCAYLCKIGRAEEGIAEGEDTLKLMEKHCNIHERHLIDELKDQQIRWRKIANDTALRKELALRTSGKPSKINKKYFIK